MKKLLLLGGSFQQIIAIETAKRLGCFTVLCDYLPDNPGQFVADKFYPTSTTDKEAVLEIAKAEKVDGVLAYASDPAAPTAAYVAERLGLPTSPYKSVEILSNKDLFREFLRQNGFNTPKAKGYSSVEEAQSELRGYRFPIVIKPVDSSGSKGVSVLENATQFPELVKAALKYSRSGRFILEEYVESEGYPLAGDGFSVNGDLVFWAFADDHFDLKSRNPLAPVGESWPYSAPESVQQKMQHEIQRLLTLLGMRTTAYNLEARVDKNGEIFLMEVAPRSGGNLIPDATVYATGVNMIEYGVKAALGEDCSELRYKPIKGYWGTYMVHSNTSGFLHKVWIDKTFQRDNLVKYVPLRQPKEYIEAFNGANGTLGTMILRFASKEEMEEKMEHMDRWVKVFTDSRGGGNLSM